MWGLTPLMKGFLVAVPAVLGIGKRLRLDEAVSLHRGIARQRDPVLSKREAVRLMHLISIGFADRCAIDLRILRRVNRRSYKGAYAGK